MEIRRKDGDQIDRTGEIDLKLTMLGTGNALVTECYNTCFLIEDKGQVLLVDGGGGNAVLHQIKEAGYNWKDLRQIFVTHKHIDHLLGIVWMVRMICQGMKRGEYEGEACIYSHDEVLKLIREMAENLLPKKISAMIDDRLHLIEVKDGETKELIGHPVTFFDIQSTKAKQFGFRMEIADGKILTCSGDEPLPAELEKCAEGSEWLLHEAFCLHSQADIFHPYEKNHSTVKDACELGERLGVKNLLLYHTEDNNLANRKELYRQEGVQYYHGNLWIPNDLETMEL